MNLDFQIFHFLNQFAGKCAILNGIIIFFSSYFQYALVVILLVIALRNLKKNLSMVLSVAAAVFLSQLVITEIIRYLFFRPRPFVIEKVNLILSQSPTEPSFPSGHAAFFFALAAAAYFYNRKAGIFFYVSAFLISIARVFGGVHWPADILAGAAIGILSGWVGKK